jgi:hypothetical protein
VALYRKKPVVIEAYRWHGELLQDTDEIRFSNDWPTFKFGRLKGREGLIIETLEGDHLAELGDYIIRGVKGEYYPCKPDIFEQTYEAA